MPGFERRGVAALTLAFALAVLAPVVVAASDELPGSLQALPATLREPILRQWQQWRGWNQSERDAFAQRAAAWDALPRAERDLRRERYQAWQALPADQRQQVLAAAAQLAAQPPERRQAWRARFDALDGSQRRGWLLGPTLGTDYAVLQPLLAQLPESEHAALLRTLREMTPQQRADLGVLVQRTPPQQREALRHELATTTTSGRGDWLWQRLQY